MKRHSTRFECIEDSMTVDPYDYAQEAEKAGFVQLSDPESNVIAFCIVRGLGTDGFDDEGVMCVKIAV